jgi:hypothetical protein
MAVEPPPSVADSPHLAAGSHLAAVSLHLAAVKRHLEVGILLHLEEAVSRLHSEEATTVAA